MFNLANLTSLPYKLVGTAAIILGLLVWHTTYVDQKVHRAESAVRLEITQQYNKRTTEIKDESVKVQTELQAKVHTQQKEHNAKIHNLNLRVADLSNSLSNRPLRPSGDSGDTSSTPNGESPKGATGAGLYQDDGAFLARYAGQTEELKVNLLMCYKQYDTVKDTLDKFRVDNAGK